MQNKTVLGVDYGTKRIGLALSRASLAIPLFVISNYENPKSKPTKGVPLGQIPILKIKEICKTEEVGLIIMGLSENGMAEKTKEFAKRLEEEIDLPLEFADETLSSQSAEKKMRAGGMKQSRRSQPMDHYAAAEILQEWLDVNNAQ